MRTVLISQATQDLLREAARRPGGPDVRLVGGEAQPDGRIQIALEVCTPGSHGSA